MDSPSPADNLRLALSYFEKARAMIGQCREALDAGKITQGLHDSRCEFYTAHLEGAENAVDALRKAERRKLAGLKRELEASFASQAKLSEQVSRGRIGAATANEANQRLTRDISALTGAIAEDAPNGTATRAHDLGEFIDLSLEEYARRIQKAGEEPSPKSAPRVRRAVAIGVACALVAMGLAALTLQPQKIEVIVEATALDPSSSRIQVTCRNGGTEPIVFHVPWPESGLRDILPRQDQARSFGIQVYVREEGGGAMRLVPNSGRCWTRQGFPLVEYNPIHVDPGISARVVIDTRKFQDLGVQAEAVRLVFSRGDGREVSRFETR